MMLTKKELRERPKDFSYVALSDYDFSDYSLFIAFIPMKSEVDIIPVIKKALFEGLKVAVPDKDPYVFRFIDENLNFTTENLEMSAINQHSLMFVPGLAFSENGNRLGRGGGFYDRTLSVIPSCVKTVGVCKKSQILQDIPMDKHDIPVSSILAV